MSGSAQIPIWFFIGLLLAAYGVLILISGVFRWINPSAVPTVMEHLHPAVWWGLLLSFIGGFYTVRYWPAGNRTGNRESRAKHGKRPATGKTPRSASAAGSSRRVPKRPVRKR
jgi:hypothetical protein